MGQQEEESFYKGDFEEWSAMDDNQVTGELISWLAFVIATLQLHRSF